MMPPAASPFPLPFAALPLSTRADVAQLCAALARPVLDRASAGGARVRLGTSGAHFTDVAAEIEGFARPLWGLAPLHAGGFSGPDWPRIAAGLAAGTDPTHPEYWGAVADSEQPIVEMAGLGLALALAPDALWHRQPGAARQNIVTWLRQAESRRPADNNWWFFRIMVGLGLARVGQRPDSTAREEAFTRLEAFHRGDGWYDDGRTNQRDHYIAFAFHFYALIYAALASDDDPARAALFRARARAFAADYRHWFAADGSALPFGRSLTYRFAHAAFWGALAFANEAALPWGLIKGLYLRNLRWWMARPMSDRDGVLSLGYAYASQLLGEEYNSPASPYWAMKAFLPLALPDTHPFWQAEELADDAAALPAIQPHPGFILFRAGDQTIALASGQSSAKHRQAAAKYGKFAYSTAFGFSVESDTTSLARGAFDSTLALSDDGGAHWRQRGASTVAVQDGALVSVWHPWPDVTVQTELVPAAPWHVRRHVIRTPRPLLSAEGGFALDRTGDSPAGPIVQQNAGSGFACVRAPAGFSGLRDLDGRRDGEVVRALPNTNVMAARTLIPMLLAPLPAGQTRLVCAVLALPADQSPAAWDAPPA